MPLTKEAIKIKAEKQCMKALSDFLRESNLICSNVVHRTAGEDPPDFTACIADEEFAIEITEFPLQGVVGGKPQSRQKTEVWLDQCLRKIQDRAQELRAQPGRYFVRLSPLEQGKKQDCIVEELAHLIATAESHECVRGMAVVYREDSDELRCEKYPDLGFEDSECWEIIGVKGCDTVEVVAGAWSYDSKSEGIGVPERMNQDNDLLNKTIRKKHKKLINIQDPEVKNLPKILLLHGCMGIPSRLNHAWCCEKGEKPAEAEFFHSIFVVNQNDQGDRVIMLKSNFPL